MLYNYLITAWRNLRKNIVFSLINIMGLAIGLASCIMIMLFVRDEMGYENWLPNADRVVRLHTASYIPGQAPFLSVTSAGRMMDAIADFAKNEVADGVRLVAFDSTVRKESDAFSEQVVLADNSFFSIFELPFLEGDAKTAFAKPMDLIISEEMANKYFGKTNAVGEFLDVMLGPNTISLQVTGVISDLPYNTHLDLDLLIYMQPAMLDPYPQMLKTWTSRNVFTYFKLNDGVTVEHLQQRIDYWMNNESPFVEMLQSRAEQLGDNIKVTDLLQHNVMAIPDIHLYAKAAAGNGGDMRPLGDIDMVNSLSLVALLVLVIACINFVNLSTARAGKRAKEVSLRKVLGASRTNVAIQFMGETLMLVTFALVLALCLVEITLPLYNSVLSKDLTMNLLEDHQLLSSLFVSLVVVGLLAGAYPALMISQFKPAHVLKANKSQEGQGSSKFRSLLVVFQFAVSMTLIICTAIIYGQTHFANNLDLGYSTENKLILNIRNAGDNLDSLKQQLEALPAIESVVFSSEAPSQDSNNNTGFKLLENIDQGSSNEALVTNYYSIGYGFFEAYQVTALAGRTFSRAFGSDEISAVAENANEPGKGGVILNQSAVAKFGFADAQQALGKTLEVDVFGAGLQHVSIVGVIPDIYFRSLKFGLRPSVYLLNPGRFSVATISYRGENVSELITAINEVWKSVVPAQPIDLRFLNDMMHAQYADELAQAKLFAAFALLAILVACLGLYGLAAFTAEHRTKEIGVRKVMGAGIRDLVTLLVWQFSKPVLWANLLAWPTAFYLMHNWLQNFQYRLGYDVLFTTILVSGLVAMAVAWMTVASRAYKVARANPIHALRYE